MIHKKLHNKSAPFIRQAAVTSLVAKHLALCVNSLNLVNVVMRDEFVKTLKTPEEDL